MLILTRSVEPTLEPLTLAEIRDHCRIDGESEDAILAAFLVSARRHLEEIAGVAFLTQTLIRTMDRFPSSDVLYLPRPPLQSVTSISYLDADGVAQTFAAANYTVDTLSEPGRIGLVPGSSWPTTRQQIAAVSITYVAGWTQRAAVPEDLRLALRLLVGEYFENRESAVAKPPSSAVVALVANYGRTRGFE